VSVAKRDVALLNEEPRSLPKNWRIHIKNHQTLDEPGPTESDTIVTGARNETLTSIAGKLHNTGIGSDALLCGCWLKTKNALFFGDQTSMPFLWLYSPEIHWFETGPMITTWLPVPQKFS
jgi:hypothetical protein